MLEYQIAQQASSSSKATGKLPSQPKTNPKEHYKVVTLRSGRTLEKQQLEEKSTEQTTDKSNSQTDAILQNKLPSKLKDPGSFSIPCLIGNMKIDRALCDLSASLADRSVKYPVGILENIPIKVGKFFIPVDFVFLEMEEDVQIPIILGRPFLATVGAIIDIKNGQLTLKVGDEEVEFNLFKAVKHKLEPNESLRVDITNRLVKEELHRTHSEDPLEACTVHSYTANKENTKIAACAQSLEVNISLPLAQALQVKELKEEQPKNKSQEDPKQVELKLLPSTLRVLPPKMSYQQIKKFLNDVRFYT
ncbi:uncharacterized protein LOC131183067 [Hevea brasiliensis]|uniref:uncharacterized protein LOC131183067 n=1 Tax=Hevea brasiliensis TaxID=3981 RepID=UPI0025E6DB6A|nr:uncharacterized protein LOC131183067 [Hevea brasiliensis]